jgi:catechol-2,3-dioxygenase
LRIVRLTLLKNTRLTAPMLELSMVEKISAVTLRVANMEASVRFYKDVLGLEIIYGGEGSYFTSLRTKDGDTILNIERGNAGIQWGG